MIHTDVDRSQHFHIFWHGKDSFDWEAFDSYDDAAAIALRIVLPGEVFSIKCLSTECPACKVKLRHSLDTNLQISN